MANDARKRWRERARRMEHAARQVVGSALIVDSRNGEAAVSAQAVRRLEWLLALNDAEKFVPHMTADDRAKLEHVAEAERLVLLEDRAKWERLNKAGLTGWAVSGMQWYATLTVTGRAVVHLLARADRAAAGVRS